MKRLPDRDMILFARMVLCGFVSGALLIFMHELGHGIVAVVSGAKITRFNLLKGFIETDGGTRGYIVRQLFYAAGQIFPGISAVVYACLYRRGGEELYRLFSFLYETVCVFSLFDWVVTPVQEMFGRAPAGDDCTMFLENYSFHPLTVSIAALCAAALLIFVSLRRGIPADFMETVRDCLDKRS